MVLDPTRFEAASRSRIKKSKIKNSDSPALFALSLSLLWGGLSSATKIALDYIPRLGLAGVRFSLGLIAIVLWARVTRQSLRLSPSERRALFPLGLLFALQIGVFNLGIDYGLASHAVVLINTHPVFVCLLAHFFLDRDRLTLRKVCGLSAAMSGVFALFAEQWVESTSKVLWGSFFGLLSGFLLGLLIVRTKALTAAITPVKIVAGQYVIGVPLFFLLGVGLDDNSVWSAPDLPLIAALLYQGVLISGFCFIGNAVLLSRYPASQISVFSFTSPVFGALISHFLLGDPLTRGLAGGAVLVALGVYMAQGGEKD